MVSSFPRERLDEDYYRAMDIKAVVNEFVERLQALLEGQAIERAKAVVLDAFGVPVARKPGRPRKAETVSLAARSTRRKLPRQLCPVPGCTNTAAPVFGMVCAKHKNVAKSKIRKFREARRAKKVGVQVTKTAPVRRAKKSRAKSSQKALQPKAATPGEARDIASGAEGMGTRSE